MLSSRRPVDGLTLSEDDVMLNTSDYSRERGWRWQHELVVATGMNARVKLKVYGRGLREIVGGRFDYVVERWREIGPQG